MKPDHQSKTQPNPVFGHDYEAAGGGKDFAR